MMTHGSSWVWISISEAPATTTLIGGAVVVGAVVLQATGGSSGELEVFIDEGGVGEAHGVHTHNPVIIHLIEGYVQLAAQQLQPR